MHEMNIGGVDLNLLPALDALLAERSVSRAARRLGLSQPAMSHALGRLRALFDDPLLVRTPDGMTPTPRAEALAEPLRAALDGLRATLRPAPRFDPARVRRTVRIGTTDYGELVVLTRLLPRLADDAPGLDVWVHNFTDGAAALLAAGELDLVLAPVRPEDRAAGLHTADLFEERFVCVMRRGHPLARKKLTLDRFVAARHALIAPRARAGGAVDDALARLGRHRRVALAVPHFLVAPQIVARTDLVLTVAERVARAFSAQLPLKIVEPPLALPRFTLSALWHDRQDADPALAWLRARIVEVARKI